VLAARDLGGRLGPAADHPAVDAAGGGQRDQAQGLADALQGQAAEAPS
jgi:hypothetical protein